VGQRSLKVIEISAIRKFACGFLFAFYSNYDRICSRLWDIQCQRMAWPWKPRLGVVQGHWKWRRSIDICDFLLVRHCKYSFVPFSRFLTLNYIVTLKSGLEVSRHSMSLKLEPFERLGAVSYSSSIVTVAVSVAVCEIFSVKEWRDLENQVMGRSRS